MKNWYVSISQEAVLHGQRRNRACCAIALSLAAKYPELRYINVDREEIRFTDSHNRMRYCYVTPSDAVAFIDKYDQSDSNVVVELPPQITLVSQALKWCKPKRERSVKDMVARNLNIAVQSDPGVGRKVTNRPPSPKSMTTRPVVPPV